MRHLVAAFLIAIFGLGGIVRAEETAAPAAKPTSTPAKKKPVKKSTSTSKPPATKAQTPPAPPAQAGTAAAGASAAQGNLGSMEVTGQAKDKVLIEKVTPEIKIDIREFVDSVTDKTEKLLEQGRPIPSKEDFRQFDRLASQQTARPWLPDLVEPPLISFQPAPAKSTVIAWRLEVTDDKGDIVHTIIGKGNPVNEIVWDGFNKEGQMIRVASAYSFRFITVDEFKEAHTTLGKAFTLRHLKYRDKKNLIVEFSSSYLFRDEKMNPEALPVFERALDVLREYSVYPFALEFHTLNPLGDLVKGRQKVVTDKLATGLLVSPDSIKYTYSEVKDRGDVLRFVIKLR